jgi:hypothetical protein
MNRRLVEWSKTVRPLLFSCIQGFHLTMKSISFVFVPSRQQQLRKQVKGALGREDADCASAFFRHAPCV